MSGASSGPTVLIMAAGEGTRMRSALPKPLHPVCGRPMVAWPVLAAREAGAARVAVIVSPDRDLSAALPEGTETVVQPEPDGTGGAVRAALDLVRAAQTVVVLNGDHPLISAEMIAGLLTAHAEAGAAATVMSVELDEPGSYGRLVRDAGGAFERIVETKHPEDVPAEIIALREINTNTFAFDAVALAEALDRISPDEQTGEYHLGDVLALLRADGRAVLAHRIDDPDANLGVNSRADLALAAAEARRRINERHMLAGVTLVDPAATWIDADVEIAADATILPGTSLRGRSRVGAGAEVGPHATLIDAAVGERSSVVHSHLVECEVGAGCLVGPFSYLRPGTRLEDGSKAGTFVEIKNSRIGERSKVPHLSYIGDAQVGEDTNLGAATITANYDGKNKHPTTIGDRVHTSVDTTLVAPVSVGDDAYTGANSAITEDVPPGALGIARPQQQNVEGYAERKAVRDAEKKAER